MAYTEDELYAMSDEELAAVVKEERMQESSPEIGEVDSTVEEEYIESDADDASEDEEEYVETTDESEQEELESGVEQPEEDSDHDTSDADAEESESDEDTDETEKDTPDGETDEDEAATAEDDEGVEEVPQPVEKYKFKANGHEYEFTRQEIDEQFPKVFGQAMDYTKKMQAIKPYRKTIDALESAKLGHEDVSLMIDVLKGDKDAMAEVFKRTGVDALDLDAENSKYVAKDYGRDEQALEIKDVIESIQSDPEYETTSDILGKQWDEKSWETMSKDPKMISLLHEDVKTGTYDKLRPIMEKHKTFDGGRKPDLEYYGMAAREYAQELAQEEQRQQLVAQRAEQARQAEEAKAAEKAAAEAARLEQVKAQEAARKASQKSAKKRKAAAPTKNTASSGGGINYLDDSDEAFEEFYFKTMGERPQ